MQTVALQLSSAKANPMRIMLALPNISFWCVYRHEWYAPNLARWVSYTASNFSSPLGVQRENLSLKRVTSPVCTVVRKRMSSDAKPPIAARNGLAGLMIDLYAGAWGSVS